MSEEIKLYQPSSGTEGADFMEDFCFQCIKCPIDPGAGHQCGIMLRTMLHDTKDKEYPKQWRYVDDKPVCTSFKSREESNARRRKETSYKDENTIGLFD
jgi:hypothetical protein